MVFSVIDKIQANLKEHIVKTVVVLVILATVYLITGNIFLSFTIGLASGILLLRWDNRLFIGIALIFLIACPFLLAFGQKDTAEEVAVYAYYMLALGVILQIIQYFKDSIFSKDKTETVKTAGPMESWSRKKMFFFTTGVFSFILLIFAGVFSFFYLRIENKLNQDDKLVNILINTPSKGNTQTTEKTTIAAPEATGAGLIALANGEINVSILNGSTISGVARGLQTKMVGQGFNVTKVGNADKSDYQNTIIEYSLNNLEKANVVKKYLTAFYNNPETLENTNLLTDIEIIIGNQ